MPESPETIEMARYVLAIAEPLTSKPDDENYCQYLERILYEYGWCVGMDKYVYAVTNQAPIILASMNTNGDFLIVNEACNTLLGYAPSELAGKNFSFLYASAEQILVKSLIASRLSSSKDWLIRTSLLAKNGQPVTMLWDFVWSTHAALYSCVAQRLGGRLETPDLDELAI